MSRRDLWEPGGAIPPGDPTARTLGRTLRECGQQRAADDILTATFTELRDAQISVQKSCALTGLSRATYYRRVNPKGPMHGPWLPRTPPPAALTDAERAAVTDLLNSPTYRDLAIPQVWARELDEGRYWCSVSTMYREGYSGDPIEV